MSESETVDPTAIVIFGAAGDLTWRKLVPALYALFAEHWLPERFALIGVDGKKIGLEELRARFRDGVDQFSRCGKSTTESWQAFESHVVDVLSADFGDAGLYRQLGGRIEALEAAWGARAQRVFYMASPPAVVETVARNLAAARLLEDRERSRLVTEKPFGHDLASARDLNRKLAGLFDESQIYRIDHYLGKETVQNILALRFANSLFEPIWDRKYIDHVQITVAERVGVEHRGGYYEGAGALRDMVQNHLLQILCLTAMEPPVSFDADEIRNKKVDVLRAIRRMHSGHVHRFAVRGQYGPGWIEGERAAGYRQAPGVAPDSNTETFAAVKLFVDNWRWQDVPFYLRTGKRMPSKVSEVSIQFRPAPHQSFPASALLDWEPNRMLIHIQPEEGIVMRFQAKRPGPVVRLGPVDMQFHYRDAFQSVTPEAYETLLLDVMRGDATLFMRADQIEESWSVIAPILEAWQAVPPVDMPNYSAGTWGPDAAQALIAQDGRSWWVPIPPGA